MPIVASELIGYNCINKPTDDTSLAGGAIDLKSRTLFTQFTSPAKITFQSSSASDNGNIAIVGRSAAGPVISETLVAGGLTETASVNTYGRIHSVRYAADAIGTITVRQGLAGTTIALIPIGERGFTSLFQRAISGLAGITRYDKIFFKNTNAASLSLIAAIQQLSVDSSGDYQVGVAAAVNDTATIANRLTAPAGISFVAISTPQDIPGTVLSAGDAIGIWLMQTLGIVEAPHNIAVTVLLSGETI